MVRITADQEPELGISNIERGTECQQEASRVLRRLRIMELLAEYQPLLVGTVPLGIQVADSDLDIICEVHDPERFTADVRRYFGDRQGFAAVTREVRGTTRTKINFRAEGWPIEIFGQPVNTREQNGWLHMLAEYRVMDLLGQSFIREIMHLRSLGMKTEPAFARLLNLEGDPYEAMLPLARLAPDELAVLCRKNYLYISDFKENGGSNE